MNSENLRGLMDYWGSCSEVLLINDSHSPAGDLECRWFSIDLKYLIYDLLFSRLKFRSHLQEAVAVVVPMFMLHWKIKLEKLLNVYLSPVRGELSGGTCSREDIPPPQAEEAALEVWWRRCARCAGTHQFLSGGFPPADHRPPATADHTGV